MRWQTLLSFFFPIFRSISRRVGNTSWLGRRGEGGIKGCCRGIVDGSRPLPSSSSSSLSYFLVVVVVVKKVN